MRQKTTAVIVAAGEGKRFGGQVSKQFVEVGGRPILYYSLRTFQQCPFIDAIVLVVPENAITALQQSVSAWRMDKVQAVVAGGAERHHSVFNGLSAVSPECQWIAIHDGVRPLVSQEQIIAVIDAAQRTGAAVLGVTPRDTIKEINHDHVCATLQRQRLIQVQTPQVFARDIILRAYHHAFSTHYFSTDDAALVERLGIAVAVAMGDHRNIKITTPDDLLYLEAYLQKESRP